MANMRYTLVLFTNHQQRSSSMATRAAERAFVRVRKLVIWVARYFCRQRCLEFTDDIRADAFYHAARAMADWTPERGPLKDYVRFRVFKELMEDARRIATRRARLKRADVDPDTIGVEQPAPFLLWDLLAGLGDDARRAVRLIFKTPVKLRRRVAERGGPSPQNYRAALRQYLYAEEGWSRRRVDEAFREVADAVA